MPAMKSPVVVCPRRAPPVLVCKKCLARNPGGSKFRRALKSELKRKHCDTLKAPRLVATGCFGICPKRAVVLASGEILQKGEYVLASHRDDIAGVLRLLQPLP